MEREEFETLLGTPRELDLGLAARLFGLEHRRIEDLADLPAALDAKTVLIEVPVDRAANAAVHRRLAGAAESALASA